MVNRLNPRRGRGAHDTQYSVLFEAALSEAALSEAVLSKAVLPKAGLLKAVANHP